jgi:hypothetical protein
MAKPFEIFYEIQYENNNIFSSIITCDISITGADAKQRLNDALKTLPTNYKITRVLYLNEKFKRTLDLQDSTLISNDIELTVHVDKVSDYFFIYILN